MSESGPRPPYQAGTPASPDRANQLSFLAPDDALTVHYLRQLVAEAQRIYETRTSRPAGEPIHMNRPAVVYELLRAQVEHLNQEQLHVLTLTVKNRLIGSHLVYQGTLSGTVVRLAEVFRPAILESAAAVVVAHNHPSGDPSPSPEDLRLSRQMAQAGQLLGIEVLDHIVIGQGRYASLRELGFMEVPPPLPHRRGGGEP